MNRLKCTGKLIDLLLLMHANKKDKGGKEERRVSSCEEELESNFSYPTSLLSPRVVAEGGNHINQLETDASNVAMKEVYICR